MCYRHYHSVRVCAIDMYHSVSVCAAKKKRLKNSLPSVEAILSGSVLPLANDATGTFGAFSAFLSF